MRTRTRLLAAATAALLSVPALAWTFHLSDRGPQPAAAGIVSGASRGPSASSDPAADSQSAAWLRSAKVRVASSRAPKWSRTVTTAPRPSPTRASAAGWWRPPVGVTWQWQLSGKLDLTVDAQVYDLDWESTSAATVAALHAQGGRVVCYVSVGSWEKYRPDVAAFPKSILGKVMDGWPDERWLDIRRPDLILPIMAKRFDICQAKGFDAIEPDNIEAYTNNSGFPLTGAHQLAFNKAIAALAHERGMSIGLKNDLGQIPALVSVFDFAVNEECHAYDECDLLTPFIAAGKAVLHVEYDQATSTFCPDTTALGFSSMRKKLALGAWRQYCP